MKPANIASVFVLAGASSIGWGVFESFGAGASAIVVGGVVFTLGMIGVINA